jgi:hypothetical protein
MSDLFNPYLEFLDLDTAPKCPTYYELLGINSSNECTHDLIENGRITALAKMRVFKPGNNAAVWAALLDEVALASTTLLDADLKAAYDKQLTIGEVPTALNLVQRSGPIERIDPSPAVSAATANPVDSMAPSHLQSGAAVSVRVAAAHSIVPTAVAVPVAAPIATVASVKVATPIAQAVTPLPDTAGLFEQSHSTGGFDGPQIKGNRRRASKKTSLPLLWVAIVLFLITGGTAIVFHGDNVRQAKVTNHDSQGPGDSQLAQKQPETDDAGVTTKPDFTKVKVRPPAKKKPLDSMPSDFGDPQNPEPKTTEPKPTEPKPTEPKPTEPKPTEPKPTEPKPAPKPIEPAELVKLTAALKLGRAALSERNLDITAEQLAIAEPLARSGEPQKAFIRLKAMHEFLTQFMRLTNEAIDNYESGAEILIGTSTIVVVVETSPQDLTFKVAGSMKTYLRNQLSTGLALGIADTNFEEFALKSTLKAAYVITQKTLRDFEVAKAREFWKMGPESIELFDGYISDDYEFVPE